MKSRENVEQNLPEEESIDNGLGVFVRKKTLYHGSSVADINKFSTAEESTLGTGVYFTSQPDKASGYAERRSRKDEDTPVVHIRQIENLKLLDLRNEDNLLKVLPSFKLILIEERKRKDLKYYYEDLLDRKIEEISSGKIHYPKEIAHQMPDLFAKYVQSLGYDGVLAIEGGEGEIGEHDTYLIFDPENIK